VHQICIVGTQMSSEQSQLAVQVIGCMVEALADDDGNIDQKCFEKIFTACVKAVLVGLKVGDQALAILQQGLGQVGAEANLVFFERKSI
jgi:hypothetical protein